MKAYIPIHVATSHSAAPRAVDRHRAVSAIGIVDDNLDPPFMQALEQGLRQRFPHATVKVWVKPVGTAPAPESLIDEMAKEVQVALAGIGL
jgi:hypothetical protein